MGVYGPLSLVLLTGVWATGLIAGFALLYYSLPHPFTDPLLAHGPETRHSDLLSDAYVSGTTLFTLGLGDVVPRSRAVRRRVVLEGGIGLGFVALIIGYFPVLYGAFSKREVNISLLDARAGSPPTAAELLRRHAFDGGSAAMIELLKDWESWAAELLESHMSYPVLAYFRSQHTNQSWLGALTAVLDTCALIVASVGGQTGRQAKLTFAMARHALVDLSQVLDRLPVTPTETRLTEQSFVQLHDLLCQVGVPVSREAASRARLNEMRELYEPYAEALGRHLGVTLPPFLAIAVRKDNWEAVSRMQLEAEAEARLHPSRADPEEEFHII